ncbi:MAG: hypothetical protein QOH25_3504 [Acidobacteriota bacterium]|jgi:ribosomal protein L24|nr:hypothetical protein [Acidobacteriota bacterium]
MTNQNNIIVGDHVRVISGSHTGEIATVCNITRLADQFGPYTRVLLNYEGVANRSMDSVVKVVEPSEVRH